MVSIEKLVAEARDPHLFHDLGCEFRSGGVCGCGLRLARARELLNVLAGGVENLRHHLLQLFDGLDANSDERCGLSSEEWDRRVDRAHDALDRLEKDHDNISAP
jgi:hypothetical protein